MPVKKRPKTSQRHALVRKGNPSLTFAALATLLAVVFFIYAPGLNGPFVLDDDENITLRPAVALKTLAPGDIAAALRSNESGVSGRPLPALSFALNHYFSGSFELTFPYKATNLAIHGINAILVWWLCVLLLATPMVRSTIEPNRRTLVALLVTALWAVHPIQLTNVLYVVQRMNSLATLFMLLGFILYVVGRLRLPESGYYGVTRMTLGAAVGLGLGSLCKENAILWPLFALVIELTLFQSSDSLARSAQHRLSLFYTALLGVVVIACAALFVLLPDLIQQGYLGRPFTPVERLLTEARILWFYVSGLLVPGANRLGLFHDDIAVSTSLVKPAMTLIAVLGIGVAAVLAVWQRGRFPIAAFAILWFLVGHGLESGIIGLELAYEHRNYLPSLGFLFAIVVLATRWAQRGSLRQTVTTVIAISVIFIFATVTWIWSNVWRDSSILAATLVKTHPASARANEFAAHVSLVEHRDLTAALRYTLRASAAAPDDPGFHLQLQLLLALLGKEIANDPSASSIHRAPDGAEVKIPGIETSFRVGRSNRALYLTHPASFNRLPDLVARAPITAHTVSAIENLRHCILVPPHDCATVQSHALSWFASAAENTNAIPDYRAIIAANAAILYAHHRDYVSAYKYMTRATEQLPSVISYRVLRAEYLIRLCRLVDARRVIETLPHQPAADRVRDLYAATEQNSKCRAALTSPASI